MNRLVRWFGAGPVRSGATSLIWSGPVRFSIKRTGRTKTEVSKSRIYQFLGCEFFSPAGRSSSGEPGR